ncbi:MAG: LacI family transcriptional regulator [Planctomycetaceae bacterium]|nr:LacI family transcriptional regulator [Planctomycetaceae bacterium]
MITTRELARLAGVSQFTVSRSLNNHPAIPVKTRERIAELAREHGYEPRATIRKQTSRRGKKAIAVLMTGIPYTNLYLESMFIKIFSEIEKAHYLALHVNDADLTVNYDRVAELVETGIIAGFIIINLHYNPHVHDYLVASKIPHVYLHYFGKNSLEALDIIDTDNYLGGHLAASHLLQLGHKKIKVLTSSASSDKLDSHTFVDRTSGFREAIRAAGMTLPDRDLAWIQDHNFEKAYEYVSKHLDHVRAYDAVFAQTDTMAMGYINAFHDNGISVPDEISVMGYDGIEEGILCRPAVTTIRQPISELAEETLARLLSLIHNPVQTTRRSFIQPTLLIRQSTRSIL